MFSDSNKKEFTGFNGLQVLIFSDGIESEILYLYADPKKKSKREEGERSEFYSIFGNFTIHVNFFDPTPTLDPPLDRTYTITHILNSDLFYY